MSQQVISRYAPSTTGPPHPGTLLAALLCWLDARSQGARLILRLEDIDRERCRPEFSDLMRESLDWFGLDWDAVDHQREASDRHAVALDRLEAAGRLYPCRCSRAQIRASGKPTPAGGFSYLNRCRNFELPSREEGGWRASRDVLRVRLADEVVRPFEESEIDLDQNPAQALGDPVVRRRDGSFAYHLACVVDDAFAGVNRIVRGRDLAPSTATQVALQEQLGFEAPVYRHHLLLLERQGQKLAKLHGSVGIRALRERYDAEALCGLLAFGVRLRGDASPLRPVELLGDFDWRRVRSEDRLAHWNGDALELGDPVPQHDASR